MDPHPIAAVPDLAALIEQAVEEIELGDVAEVLHRLGIPDTPASRR